MARASILQSDESYSFSRYFELPYAIDDVLAEFDCSVERGTVALPQAEHLEDLQLLLWELERNRQRIELINEATRREALIGPVLFEACARAEQRLNIEYAIAVDDRLKGTLDYYVNSPQNLLVIEAKQSDLVKGFTQLGVELIALDQWTRSEAPLLYGAVTTGEDWRFGVFHRAERRLCQDQRRFRVPEELAELMAILVGILQG
ncbi:MAG: hypothetical protein HC824_21730 [Synechococcales cyanobacterium RM1_1_8]|nr:hypothetical protein [Synechococcales cyanobacterium RM1_1_8]